MKKEFISLIENSTNDFYLKSIIYLMIRSNSLSDANSSFSNNPNCQENFRELREDMLRIKYWTTMNALRLDRESFRLDRHWNLLQDQATSLRRLRGTQVSQEKSFDRLYDFCVGPI